jgi:pyrroline-5-carboxylate reductase
MRAFEIGVIGAGNAAEGIVHGILRNTLLFADRMIASDPAETRRGASRLPSPRTIDISWRTAIF